MLSFVIVSVGKPLVGKVKVQFKGVELISPVPFAFKVSDAPDV
jgi:hypothetical protein